MSILPLPPPPRPTEHTTDSFQPVFVLPSVAIHPPLLCLCHTVGPPISETLAMYVLSALSTAPYCVVKAADGLVANSAVLSNWFPRDAMWPSARCV